MVAALHAPLAARLVAAGRGAVGRRRRRCSPRSRRSLLDPIFNDFTPLPEGETRARRARAGARRRRPVGEVYSVDASRRTTAANAYVTGLGPTKRVVLFDTLLDRYARDEVRVVVAHELAHVRHRDVPRGVAFAAIVGARRRRWPCSGSAGRCRDRARDARRAAGAGARRGDRSRCRSG